nr:hypothetical protein CFP56_00941 [Quercus suber]
MGEVLSSPTLYRLTDRNVDNDGLRIRVHVKLDLWRSVSMSLSRIDTATHKSCASGYGSMRRSAVPQRTCQVRRQSRFAPDIHLISTIDGMPVHYQAGGQRWTTPPCSPCGRSTADGRSTDEEKMRSGRRL